MLEILTECQYEQLIYLDPCYVPSQKHGIGLIEQKIIECWSETSSSSSIYLKHCLISLIDQQRNTNISSSKPDKGHKQIRRRQNDDIYMYIYIDKLQSLLKEEKTNKDWHLPYKPPREFQAGCGNESKKTQTKKQKDVDERQILAALWAARLQSLLVQRKEQETKDSFKLKIIQITLLIDHSAVNLGEKRGSKQALASH